MSILVSSLVVEVLWASCPFEKSLALPLFFTSDINIDGFSHSTSTIICDFLFYVNGTIEASKAEKAFAPLKRQEHNDHKYVFIVKSLIK